MSENDEVVNFEDLDPQLQQMIMQQVQEQKGDDDFFAALENLPAECQALYALCFARRGYPDVLLWGSLDESRKESVECFSNCYNFLKKYLRGERSVKGLMSRREELDAAIRGFGEIEEGKDLSLGEIFAQRAFLCLELGYDAAFDENDKAAKEVLDLAHESIRDAIGAQKENPDEGCSDDELVGSELYNQQVEFTIQLLSAIHYGLKKHPSKKQRDRVGIVDEVVLNEAVKLPDSFGVSEIGIPFDVLDEDAKA